MSQSGPEETFAAGSGPVSRPREQHPSARTWFVHWQAHAG